MLGLPPPVANADGSSGYRLDEASQRLVVTAGKADDLRAIGVECRDDATLDRLLSRAAEAGFSARESGAALRSSRRVRRLYTLNDPAGNAVELHAGAEVAADPFRSALFPGGFRTGEAGLGHAVLNSPLREEMERFYVQALGFAVTESLAARSGPIEVHGTFLHCNRRHHSIALFDLPVRKRLHHFMLQASELRAVGAASERARQLGVPFSLGLGQHPDPDGTVSFYGVTPSGFDFEIGAQSNEIEPAGWQPLRTDVASTWGHKPSLRLQLKMAGGLMSRKLRGPVKAVC